MIRRLLLLGLLFAGVMPGQASADCDVKPPTKDIFAYPSLMQAHIYLQDYEIRVFDSFPCEEPLFKDRSGLEILKAGKRVFAQTGYGFAIGYPLDQDQPPDSVRIKGGDDITGEGQPELLISEWTGGAHCCYSFSIFRLGNTFQKLPDISLFDADESSFVRRPGIKSLVLVTADYSAFAYFPTSFAGSPAGRVLLSFQSGKFRLDTSLMKADAPKSDEVTHCATLFKPSREWKTSQPMGMWYYATDLIYTGNAAQAWRFLDAAWGGPVSEKKKYLDDYQHRLKKSVYYPELMQLQKVPVSSAGQKIDWMKQCFEYMHG
jgi:hypothetical protein